MATINSCNTQLVPIASSNVTYTLQPAFSAYTNLQSNVTGNSVSYTVLFANETVDKQSNFSSPNFTAPVTGKYHLSTTLYIQTLAAINIGNVVYIRTTARVWQAFDYSGLIRDVNNNCASFKASVIADMTAGDTAWVTVQCFAGTQIIDVNSGTTTTFSARLVA